ncbi:MAG: hypothetical protein HQL69_06450 [Magnetococcales bacterium]|nr:hypothetical protein [Magnetococcales bacterium]
MNSSKNNSAANPKEELMRGIAAATDNTLSDEMVEKLATTAGNVLEVADQLKDEDTRQAVSYTLQRLTRLHRIGAIETLFDLLEGIHCGRMAMTDSMVNRLLGFAEHMVSNLGNEEMASMVGTAFNALQDAVDETKNSTKSGGVLSTVTMLSKPETQQALQFLILTAAKMKEHFGEEEK